MRAGRQAPLVLLALAAGLSPPAAADPATAIDAARRDLDRASQALERAGSAGERLRALGQAAAAAERALLAYRLALRAMSGETARLAAGMEADAAEIERLVAILQSLARAPRSALLAYPDGPLDAIRAAALMAAITPELDRRRLDLALRLETLSDLQTQQAAARDAGRAVLSELQRLRAETAQALEEGSGQPASHKDMVAQARAAAAGARDLAALAAALADALPSGAGGSGFAARTTPLPLPVAGRVTAGFGEPDPWGRPGAGLTLSAPAWAEVRAPADATIRYAGPLADYGQVVILEPDTGHLIVLAGLGRVTRRAGDTVRAGEPLGDLGGVLPASAEFLLEASANGGEIGEEKLYIELRQDGEAIDPAPWFDTGGKRGP